MAQCDHNDSWAEILRGVGILLCESDDPRLWEVAIAEVFCDAEYLCGHARSKSPIFAEIGACSHWQRPHQHRWLKDGSFAAPFGYGGNGFNIHAIPVLDWSLTFAWDTRDQRWVPAEKMGCRRPLTLRVTVPARTAKHDQAAVHTVWTPGSPTTPDHKAIHLYGFRRKNDQWQCTASAGHESAYEYAAKGK